MGRSKGQRSDRMYMTQSEWVNQFGGKAENEKDLSKAQQRKVPFYCCSLSMTPFTDGNAVATPEGTVYDLLNIIPFLAKHKVDPLSGKPLKENDLIKLNFHKNEEGKYHCPLTYKEFTDYSHIVFIKTTGNVYSYEAINELNIKLSNWEDLISSVPFKRSDIIVIQDPLDTQHRKSISDFYFIQNNIPTPAQEKNEKGITETPAIEKIMTQLSPSIRSTEKKETTRSSELKPAKPSPAQTKAKKEDESIERLSKKVYEAPGFTATGFSGKVLSGADEPAQRKTKKKGYVSLKTNLGDINIQLHTDVVPKTTENFLKLCKSGYYNNCIFHRSIPKFMIQGGDPTGTGRGGQSCWGKPFRDEFKTQLQHNERGVVSMANCGPNTNTSQFFILFSEAKHLNGKHTVFGKVVGGLETLDAMEKVPTNRDDDRPVQEIKIISAHVFLDPFEEDEKLSKASQLSEEDKKVGQWFSNPSGRMTASSESASRKGVGKYLLSTPTTTQTSTTEEKKRPALVLSETSTQKTKVSKVGDPFARF